MAWVRAANRCLRPPGIQCLKSSPRCINLSCLCSEQRSIQGEAGWQSPTCSGWGWAELPRGFSGQLSPCLGRSSQFASLDFRLWCLQGAEVLFWYPIPFWTYVCSITLLKYSENQTPYWLFSNYIRCYSHIFFPFKFHIARCIGSVPGNFSLLS